MSQVLVPSCVFVSPAESRRAEAVERVRSFSAAQLAAGARAQRWDRVRLVCSQPYNKHCKVCCPTMLAVCVVFTVTDFEYKVPPYLFVPREQI